MHIHTHTHTCAHTRTHTHTHLILLSPNISTLLLSAPTLASPLSSDAFSDLMPSGGHFFLPFREACRGHSNERNAPAPGSLLHRETHARAVCCRAHPVSSARANLTNHQRLSERWQSTDGGEPVTITAIIHHPLKNSPIFALASGTDRRETKAKNKK